MGCETCVKVIFQYRELGPRLDTVVTVDAASVSTNNNEWIQNELTRHYLNLRAPHS